MIACNFYQEGLRETFHTAPNGELLVGYSRYFTSQFSCRSGRRSSNLMLDWWNAWQREEEGTHFELLLLAPTRKARQRERPDLRFSICTDRETRSCSQWVICRPLWPPLSRVPSPERQIEALTGLKCPMCESWIRTNNSCQRIWPWRFLLAN